VLLETPPDPEETALKKLRRILLAVDQALVKPDVDPAKAAVAAASYAPVASYDDILFQVDNSATGRGENGIVATWGAIHAKSLFGGGRSVRLGPQRPVFTVDDEDVVCEGVEIVKLETGTGGLLPLTDVAVALNFLAGRVAGAPDPKDPFDDPAPPPEAAAVYGPMSEAELLTRLAGLLAPVARCRVKPGLDPEKLRTALKSYAVEAREEDVLFQVDDTQSGEASFGLAVTRTGTYARWSGQDPVAFPLGPPVPEIIVKDDFIGIDGRRAARLTFLTDPARRAVAVALGFLARVNAAGIRTLRPLSGSGPGGAYPESSDHAQGAGPGPEAGPSGKPGS
jgi:hypothetical protein